MSENHTFGDEEPEEAPLKMHSKAFADFFPEVVLCAFNLISQLLTCKQHYAATGGRASPRLPHEMSEEALLATAIARFRPLNQPLPDGFDLESLPVYRAPISHQEIEAAGVESSEHATTPPSVVEPSSHAPEDLDAASTQPAVASRGPDATQSAAQRLSCQWHGCSRTFAGADGPALLVVCPYHPLIQASVLTLLQSQINNDHIGLPVPGIKFNNPNCRWGNCSYRHATRRFLVAHCMTRVPNYKLFWCSQCGRGFQQKAHVVSHEERMHAKK
ncbi:unnamed protein product [Aureobasidium mustum]|uniref:C2H2-type domain-containing protein n=1 Tax=Aureobasidium mustum TaxID=2773714 RepID=A0A9N8JXU4_9PEZI|nr:unnamed protein product [Aureobasidium mustum]